MTSVTSRAVSVVPLPRAVERRDGDWPTTDPRAEAVRKVDPSMGREAYRVEVTGDGASLVGGSEAALRWAADVLTQLADNSPTPGRVPCVEIRDEPEFAWRGVLLDVARHFMPKEFVLRLVDAMAALRLNILHLHLTDDQGWRVEIDAYPRLTQVGAWRAQTLVGHALPERRAGADFSFDGSPHGGFYTKDDLREIVAHAAARGITVVPEIDLPGHMQAAIAAYPHLGNRPDVQLPVRETWGVSDHVLNVSDEAVEFARTVVREVLEIFPGPWIHLGGDECPTVEWEASPEAVRRAAELGLDDVAGLQGWFTEQVAAVAREQGRRVVAWDELLERGAPADTVVMGWRSRDQVTAAARAGHDTVNTAWCDFYLDFYQGDPAHEPLAIGGLTTLEAVHAARVVPEDLSPAEQARIVGAQAQLWTEYMPDPEAVAYMAFPRLAAFAERVWGSPPTPFAELEERLEAWLPRLSELGLGWRPLDPARQEGAS